MVAAGGDGGSGDLVDKKSQEVTVSARLTYAEAWETRQELSSLWATMRVSKCPNLDSGISKLVKALAAVLLLWPFEIVATSYPFQVERVIDGDTIKGLAEIWPGISVRTSVRINGVNAPEIHAKRECEKTAAKAAKLYVEGWVQNGPVELVDVSLGKYAGRVLGDLVIDSHRLSGDLMRLHLAAPYTGGKRGEYLCRD